MIKRILSLAAAILTLTAISANARPVTTSNDKMSVRHEAAKTAVEAVSAEGLRTARVPESLIQRFVAASSSANLLGLPEIPESELPTVFMNTEGDGDLIGNAVIPIPTPFPVLSFVKRCEACPWISLSGVWTQSTWSMKPARADWVEVKQVPDVLNNAYFANFDVAGAYEVKVSVFHPAGVFITKIFDTMNVAVADLYAYGCFEGTDGSVRLTAWVEALAPIVNHSEATLSAPGFNGRTLTLTTDSTDSRHAQGSISLSYTEYGAFLAGSDVPMTLSLDQYRSAYRVITFGNQVYNCGEKG